MAGRGRKTDEKLNCENACRASVHRSFGRLLAVACSSLARLLARPECSPISLERPRLERLFEPIFKWQVESTLQTNAPRGRAPEFIGDGSLFLIFYLNI